MIDNLQTTAVVLPSESDVDAVFKRHGGKFHGPHIETAVIRQIDFYGFVEEVILMTAKAAAHQIRKNPEVLKMEAALKVIVGTSCFDPENDEGESAQERLQRVSDMARVTLGIPL